MRLEAVTLHGFKSFAEKSVIKVLPGITGIVGPNGCGKCLAGDTLVALADGRRVPIRTLVETALASSPSLHHFDDGVAGLGDSSGVEVLSLDPSTLRVEPRPVQAFVRRAAPDFMLRVRTRSGREVVSTHYHPFFTLAGGNMQVLTADTLVPGVRIAVPRTLPIKPTGGASVSEAVLDGFTVADRVVVPRSLALEEWLAGAAGRVGGWQRLAQLTGVTEAHLRGIAGVWGRRPRWRP